MLPTLSWWSARVPTGCAGMRWRSPARQGCAAAPGALGATGPTLGCGGKVHKEVMNIRISGSLIVFHFLEMNMSPIQATRRCLCELGVLCELRLIVPALIKLPFQS